MLAHASCHYHRRSSSSARTSAGAGLRRLQLAQQLADALLQRRHTLRLPRRQRVAALQLALAVLQQAMQLSHLPLPLLKQQAQCRDAAPPVLAAGRAKRHVVGRTLAR